jgi:DNA polymerase V
MFKLKDIIVKHDIKLLSSNYVLYGDMSSRVMEVISRFSPEVEVYSIDECFLSFDRMDIDLEEYGRTIRETVRQWTGIPVSVGIAPTKTLAKIANRIAKKNREYDGVFNLIDNPDIEKALERIEVKDIWGIGSRKAERLNNFGIRNARELRDVDHTWARKNLGGIVGIRTVLELNGVSSIPMEVLRADKKQIICSRSFGKAVDDIEDLSKAIAGYTTRVAEKLRRQGSNTAYIQVFLNTDHFKDVPQHHESSGYSIPVPTSYTSELIGYARKILEKLYRRGYKYKKCGVMVAEIGIAKYADSDLFTKPEQDKKRADLMKVVDKLNKDFGSSTVRYAANGFSQPFAMKRDLLSPRYTTRWEELLVVRI